MNEIVRLDENNIGFWEEHIKKNPETRIQHSLKFMKVIKETYRNCEYNYFLYKSKEASAIFPFFLVKSRIFGDRMICMPFIDVGGFSGKYDSGIIKKLVETLKDNIPKIKHIEIRLNTSLENFDKTRKTLLKSGFTEKKNKHQFIIFPSSKEEMWKKFHKHTRNDIRKAQKSGLMVKGINNKEELKKFYEIYLKEMKDFGTPQHSYKFFENLLDIFGENLIGFNCYHGNNLAGSLMMYYHNNHAYISFNVSDPNFRNYRPNDLLYWTAITWLLERGVRDIDLGQVEKNSPKGSRAHGLYKFKAKWLGKLHERVYFYWPKEKSRNREREKYKKLRGTWSKIPMFVIKRIGPKICSELGI